MNKNLWAAVSCYSCDFGSGHRGMDRCGKCDGTGSILIYKPTNQRFPNTEEGWADMTKVHKGGKV